MIKLIVIFIFWYKNKIDMAEKKTVKFNHI